jgi:hypothetical protein
MSKVFLIILSQFLFSYFSYGQRFVDRFYIINPLMHQVEEMEGRRMAMHSMGGYASFSRFLFIKDMDHEYFSEMGAYAELMRWGNKSNIMATALIEVIMDPHNDINFNPRAIIWEEGLYYSRRLAHSFLKLGFVQRCKHDIDNLLIAQQRTLIFSSLRGEYIIPINTGENSEALIQLRSDIYAIMQDHRIPREHEELYPEMNRLIGALGTTMHYSLGLTETFGFFANGYTTLNFMSDNRDYFGRFTNLRAVRPNAGIYTGISVHGNARMRIGAKLEYFTDTGIHVLPRSSWLLSFGFMVFNPQFMR